MVFVTGETLGFNSLQLTNKDPGGCRESLCGSIEDLRVCTLRLGGLRQSLGSYGPSLGASGEFRGITYPYSCQLPAPHRPPPLAAATKVLIWSRMHM
jgi:hypothetical protein